jgi:hypothetical protein
MMMMKMMKTTRMKQRRKVYLKEKTYSESHMIRNERNRGDRPPIID